MLTCEKNGVSQVFGVPLLAFSGYDGYDSFSGCGTFLLAFSGFAASVQHHAWMDLPSRHHILHDLSQDTRLRSNMWRPSTIHIAYTVYGLLHTVNIQYGNQ